MSFANQGREPTPGVDADCWAVAVPRSAFWSPDDQFDVQGSKSPVGGILEVWVMSLENQCGFMSEKASHER